MRHVALVVLAFLTACSADIPNGVIACERDGDCPTDWFCQPNNRCYSERDAVTDSGVAGTGGDGGDGGGGGIGGVGGSSGDGGSAGECRTVADSPCGIVCLERCNNTDDDCDGVVDNNGAASSCNIANAEAACLDGTCLLQRCEPGYADCNDDDSDGCESFLRDDPENCGLCGARCIFLNAGTGCSESQCVRGPCLTGFDDCDGQPSNGCETSVTGLTTCGSCRGRCAVGPNALPTCDAGVCAIAECVGNYADCDGSISNGCEQPLDVPDNCGACGVDCGTLPNAFGTCGQLGCEGVVCTGEYRDCDGLPNNGCEALLTEPDNCGACGMRCDLPNVAVHVCETTGAATCGVDDSADNGGCDAGFADCNATAADGCERPLNTLNDCGACGTPCSFPNGLASCETGTCVLAGCAPGFEDCNDDGACDSLNTDPNNCGSCDNICGATLNCSGGRCRLASCPSGQADCNDDDACENLNTANNCGTCGAGCPASLPNATGSCSTGTCAIVCNAGFANCNGDASDGCETSTRTLSSCGACGVTCSIANANATCATGSCRVDTCSPTHGDCNTDNTSCETSLSLPTSCGDCDADCTGKPNTTGAGCSGGDCSFTCQSGFRDCDAMPGNGCEASLNSPSTCGDCSSNCATLDHVALATCTGTGCEITACDGGFDDCDGLSSNGCEADLNSLSDCGACNVTCTFANASATCGIGGVCSMGACSAGFGDCDTDPDNGCETPFNTLTNCGACGTVCGNGLVCNNGVCGPATCPAGFSYCGGSTCIDITGSCPPWPGCTRAKPNINHCGACNTRCPLYGGEHCCI